MKYLGKVEFGGLYFNEQTLKIPTKPYNSEQEVFNGSGLGDVYSFTGEEYSIGNTPTESEKKIIWHKFKEAEKIIYICDRVLINNISHNEINELLLNQYIYIDGKKYVQRLMTEFEWNELILDESVNCGVVSLPKIPKKLTQATQKNNHNRFWNWVGMYTHIDKEGKCICYGYSNPSDKKEISLNYKASDVGFRPVLEEVQIKPIITGDEGRLGEFQAPFTYEYSTVSYLDGDTLTITESINGTQIREYVTQGELTKSTIDMSPYWNELPVGNHNISIEAKNSTNEISTKTAQFNTPVSTFVHKEGLDYFATQLWGTKIKPLMEDFSKKVGGLVLDSKWNNCVGSKVLYSTNLSDNGNALSIGVTTTDKHIITFVTDTLKLGKYAIGVRAMSSTNTNTNCFKIEVVKVVGSTRTTLATKVFKDNDFGNSNYNLNYFMFDYGGSKVSGQNVEFVVTGVASTDHIVYLDYVLISPMLPSVFY